MMTVQLDQSDPNYKHSRTTCRACAKIPLDVYRVYARIDTQILKPLHELLVHLVDLYKGRNSEIDTLKKEEVYISSEFCTESFKAKFLRYVNEVRFVMGKTDLKYTYLGGTTPT